MIKLLIFDIDGVLVKSKELHEIAFIEALANHGIKITREYHKHNLDGLPTKTKIDKLSIPQDKVKSIFDQKQELTFKLAPDYLHINKSIYELFERFKKNGYKISVASNAIRPFCELTIDIMKIGEYVDYMLSNEDVDNPKPSPEIYTKIIEHFGVKPREALIFEDSKFGLRAAFLSGAHVYHVHDPSYMNAEQIWKILEVYANES